MTYKSPLEFNKIFECQDYDDTHTFWFEVDNWKNEDWIIKIITRKVKTGDVYHYHMITLDIESMQGELELRHKLRFKCKELNKDGAFNLDEFYEFLHAYLSDQQKESELTRVNVGEAVTWGQYEKARNRQP